MSLDHIIFVLTPAFIIGLYLITQSCTDFALRREIYGFNWRARQWQLLNNFRSLALNMMRFIFGCLIIATVPMPSLWLVVWIGWFMSELAIGYQPKAKRQSSYD